VTSIPGLLRRCVAFLATAKLSNDLVYLITDLLVALECHHVRQSFRPLDLNERVRLSGVFVRNIFDNNRVRM
jgi:hypothetical protein